MTDEAAEPEASPQEDALARQALARLAFLAPPGSPRAAADTPEAAMPAPSPAAMPDEVWARLVAALPAQQSVASVVELRPRRRWLPAVAAAAVAVVAVGIGASVLRPAPAPVAGAPAPAAGPTADKALAAPAPPAEGLADGSADTAANASADSGVQAAPPADGPMVGAAAPSARSMIMPTRMLTSTGTQYTSAQLDQQVDGLLTSAGAVSPDAGAALPTPTALTPVGAGGFTADLRALRDCITGVMHSSTSTALIVDRATFDGGDAAIVIVPVRDQLDVYVVGPDCTASAPTVLHHLLHAWGPSTD